jgi:hypothetical protein
MDVEDSIPTATIKDAHGRHFAGVAKLSLVSNGNCVIDFNVNRLAREELAARQRHDIGPKRRTYINPVRSLLSECILDQTAPLQPYSVTESHQ